jgi:transposase
VETLTSQSKEELIALVLQLRALVKEQADTLRLYTGRIEDLEKEIAALKNGGPGKKPPPPDWVKSNIRSETTPPGQGKRPRKKREHNFTWNRREPTKIVEHSCEHCPDCGRALSGGWEYSRHQIMEIPPIAVEIIDHVVVARHCGVCGKDCVPRVDTSEETVGQSHYGHRLVRLIAYLRTMGRLPKQTIVALLQVLLGVSLSVGQISELLHRVAQQGKSRYEELRKAIQSSPYVHADETGWREDGQNGYVWSFSTPSVRYFVYDRSRSHSVPEQVLREFFGVLISDFYSGYHSYLGLHQRCWVHLLRDVRELKQKYPTEGVLEWVKQLRDIYDRAKAFSSACPKMRQAARLGFQAELLELAVPYVNACLPQRVLCKRLVQFEAELFTFVEYPEVPSENNAAERGRPLGRASSGNRPKDQRRDALLGRFQDDGGVGEPLRDVAIAGRGRFRGVSPDVNRLAEAGGYNCPLNFTLASLNSIRG